MKAKLAQILVLGAGESGVGAALLAQKKAFPVFVSDKGRITEKYKSILSSKNIDFEDLSHQKAEELIDTIEDLVIVKSPGIPEEAPLIQKAYQENVKVISEIEFALPYTHGKIIAITGSNGKTTTTLLLYHLLKNAGLNVGLGGNVGESFAKQLTEKDYDFWVLEMSSFQLDNCYFFKPYISILLNITPDHLDRYQYDFEKYVSAKFRIAQKQNENDFFLYYQENQAISNFLEKNHAKFGGQFIPIRNKNSNEKEYPQEAGNICFDWENEKIEIAISEEKESWNFSEIPLLGKHNLLNATMTLTVAKILGIEKSVLEKGLASFENTEHRLEKFAEINDILFINDSKATNVDAVFYALDAFKKQIIWIAGGVDKGNDYQELMPLVKEKVRALVCLGKDNEKLKKSFSPILENITETEEISEAIEQALGFAQKNDVILLSPACASFDLFKNYIDRGEQFKKAVLAYGRRKS